MQAPFRQEIIARAWAELSSARLPSAAISSYGVESLVDFPKPALTALGYDVGCLFEALGLI